MYATTKYMCCMPQMSGVHMMQDHVNSCLKSFASKHFFLLFTEGKEHNPESVENGVQGGIKDDEVIENHSKTADERSAQESDGNLEKNEEETDGNGNKDKDDANGSTEVSQSEDVANTESENATPEAETGNEEKASEHSKDIPDETSKEAVSEDIGGKNDNKVIVENSGEKTSENVVEGSSQNGQEGSSNDKEENSGTPETEGDKGKEGSPSDIEGNEASVEDKNGDEELAKCSDGVEGVKVDNEVVNTDKDGDLEDKDSGNQDNEKPTASTTENEAVETGGNESEVNKSGEGERKEDGRQTGDQGENNDDGVGAQQVGERNEVVENESTEDGGKEGVNKDKADAVIEKTTEERSGNETENQNDKTNEALVEKVPENSSKENVENQEIDSPDKITAVEDTQEISAEKDQTESKENESEIAVGPVANLEGSHEQVSSLEDNKSEVPSENIDDLVDEILAVTDDVDAGKKSDGNTPSDKEVAAVTSENSEQVQDDGQPVVSSECSERDKEDGQPVVSSESSEKVKEDGQPVVRSENSEKSDDGDGGQVLVTSESSVKGDGGGLVSGERQEVEPQGDVENGQTSSDHLDGEIKESDAKESPRANSGNTAYRVQTGQ